MSRLDAPRMYCVSLSWSKDSKDGFMDRIEQKYPWSITLLMRRVACWLFKAVRGGLCMGGGVSVWGRVQTAIVSLATCV